MQLVSTPRRAMIIRALVAGAASAPCLAQSLPTFEGLPNPPDSGAAVAARLSADGSTLIVRGSDQSPFVPTWYTWSRAHAYQLVPPIGGYITITTVADISADGSAIVGTALYSINHSFRYLVGIGFDDVYPWHAAVAISDDGQTVAGNNGEPPPTVAYAHSPTGGAVYRPDYETYFWTEISEISGDGRVAYGKFDSDCALAAWRTVDYACECTVIPIPGMESGAYCVRAASYDGSVAAGSHGFPRTAFRWSPASGPVNLEDAPGITSHAQAMSGDGSTIVGYRFFPSGGAFIWDAQHGVRNLAVVLATDYGLADSLTGWTLTEATGISRDARTIAGNGVYNGVPTPWIAFLGGPCTADFNHDAVINSQDFFTFLACFFTPPPGCDADVNHDAATDSADLFAFLDALFTGCGG